MTTSKNFEDCNYVVSGCWPVLNNDRFGGATSGYIETPHGIVVVVCWAGFTALKTIRNGVEYRRVWKRNYSNRFLVTLARRFAEDIAAMEAATGG